MVIKEKDLAQTLEEQTPIPRGVLPMMLTATEKPPHDHEHWISEPKWNGVRAIAYIDGSQIKIKTKEDREIGGNFPELTRGFRQLSRRHSLILDGEIIYKDGKEDSSRKMVVSRINANEAKAQMASRVAPCSYIAFDVIFADGQDLRGRPLRERKKVLSKVLPKRFQDETNIASTFLERRNHGLLVEVAKREHFEGVVFKRSGSSYHGGRRSREWLKLKFNAR